MSEGTGAAIAKLAAKGEKRARNHHDAVSALAREPD